MYLAESYLVLNARHCPYFVDSHSSWRSSLMTLDLIISLAWDIFNMSFQPSWQPSSSVNGLSRRHKSRNPARIHGLISYFLPSKIFLEEPAHHDNVWIAKFRTRGISHMTERWSTDCHSASVQEWVTRACSSICLCAIPYMVIFATRLIFEPTLRRLVLSICSNVTYHPGSIKSLLRKAASTSESR